MKRKCITIVSDRDSRCYAIPTSKEASFAAWEAAVIGGEEDEYNGEDFSDYQLSPLSRPLSRPLATLVLTKPYRRFARRRAPLRNIRDARARDN